MRIETTDGISLYAEVHGDGPTIVFSCAYCTTHENWRTQVAPLVAAGWRVVLWDFRGHGRSDAPDDARRYSIEQVVDDLASVLDATAAPAPAVLAGLSFGGLASIHFALAHPARTRALVLVDSGPGFKNPEALAGWKKRVGRTAEILLTKGLEAFVAGRAAPTCIGRDPELPAARAAAASIVRQDAAGLAHFGREIAGPAPAVIDALPRVDCPALVIVGEEDEAYLRAAEVMVARLPKAEHHVVPKAGHILNIEATGPFNARVIEFLGSLAG